VDDKSGGPSYLADTWLDTCEWMGRSNLTAIYLCHAVCRFYMALALGESALRVDDPAPKVPGE